MSKIIVINKARVRNEIVRKWSDEEERKILDFIQENGAIGMPSDRVYYEEMAAATKINLRPRLLSNKVRHLKDAYLKTVEWLRQVNSRGVQQSELNEVREQVRKMCPHYWRMHSIFGVKTPMNQMPQRESIDSSIELEFDAFLAALDVENDLQSVDLGANEESNMTSNGHYLSSINDEFDDEENSRSIDDYNSSQANDESQANSAEETNTLRKARLHLETEKLEFERYKFDKMYALKKIEMDRNYELRKLELAQQEQSYNLKRNYRAAFEAE